MLKFSNRTNRDVNEHAHWALRVMMLSLLALVFWAANSSIDQVTRAPGQLISPARIQLVQSSDGGVLTKIHVKEGDAVESGQVLVTLERERALAAVSDVSAKVAALRITLARLHAEVYETALEFPKDLSPYVDYIRNQGALYAKRQKALNEDIAAQEKLLELAKTELGLNSQLLSRGDISKTEILRLEKAVADAQAQIVNRRNKYLQDSQAEMTKAQEELSTQTELLRDRSLLLQHTVLYSPVDGLVNTIHTTTLGAVVRPGEAVLEITPTSDELVVETKVNPSDIAFVSTGQSASIKLDAYDSSIYGGMRGQVSYISPDVIKEDTKQGPHTYYRVLVLVQQREFKGPKADFIRLRPGLSASVEIKAQDRTVLSYLTKPITKTLADSLGER